MPIYEYRCSKGHTFETFQNMTDDPVTACEDCGAPVERVFSPVAVHYKGSGFYTTDYARKGQKDDASKSESSSSTKDSGGDGKSSSGKEKTASKKD